MISPGTSILSDTSASLPSRTTVAVLLTIAWSFSAALSARISWKKRNTTPRTTITKMTTVARRSPVRKESTPSASEQEDQWILDVTQEAHQGRLTLLSGNLVRPELLQARIGFRLAQAAQLRSKLLQDGIGIGTRLFQ